MIGGLAILAALVFVGGVFILGAEAVSEKALPFFGIATVLAIVFCLVIFLPLSIFRATRIVPIWGFFIASYVFGVYTWMFSFLVTFSLWGVGGVFVGLCLAGIGIFPLAIIAAALHALWSTVGNLAFGIVITCGTRIFSFYLATTLDRAAKQAEVAGNVKEEEGAKPFGSPVRKEGLLTVRGFLSITHMIVLAGLWYVLAATADFLVANDRGGVLGIKLLIGYFLLMEFIFTNNWLVARVEHRMGYSSRSEENTYSVTSRTPLSDVGDETGQPTAIEVETPRPELDGLSPEQEITVTKALEESLKPLKLKVEVSYVNRSQITIVVATAAVLVITLFFPPFHYVAGRGAVSGEEFSFLLTPPKEYYTVDVTLLAIELCTCLVVGGLVYFVASGKRPSRL